MFVVEFLSLVLLIGALGWVCFGIFAAVFPQNQAGFGREVLGECLTIFLGGFAALLTLLIVLAHIEFFSVRAVLVCSLALAVVFRIFNYRIIPKPAVNIFVYLLFCLCVGGIALIYGMLTKPYEPAVRGDDATNFISYSFQIVRTGKLYYYDPLVTQMNEREKKAAFFYPPKEWIRFPGGPPLNDHSSGLIAFNLPLFPLWLALGVGFFGAPQFLYMVTLASTMALLIIGFLCWTLQGRILAIFVPLLLFFFYPQFYFAHLPMSEVLAQTIFVAGLWVFLSGLKNHAVISNGRQRLAAVLWGSLFFFRYDLIFFIPLCLLLAFSTIDILRERTADWWNFVLVMLLFLFGAIFLLEVGFHPIFGTRDNRLISFPQKLISALSEQQRRMVIRTIVVIGCIFCILFLKRLLKQWTRVPVLFRAATGIIIVVVAIISFIVNYLSWDRLVNHAQWFSLYMPQWTTAVVAIGILCCLLSQAFSKVRPPAITIILVFFAVPLLFFLVRPLMTLQQPWLMRRFVTLVFPLLFMISFLGWRWVLTQIFRARTFYVSGALLMLLSLTLFGLLQKSQVLLKTPLSESVISQTEQLVRQIPRDALILIPTQEATTNIHLTMQYVWGRSCLVITQSQSQDPALKNFLKRKALQHPIAFLAVTIKKPFYELLQDLQMRQASVVPVSFFLISRSAANTFPSHIHYASLNYRIWSSNSTTKPPVRNAIYYDDPEVTFVNFHGEESGFRWTSGESEVRDFVFDTSLKPTKLTLLVARGPKPDSLRLVVNDTFPADPVERSASNYSFRIHGNNVSQIRSVSLFCDSFVPMQSRRRKDTRELGIQFVGLRFETE